MNGQLARKLRKEQTEVKEKQFSRPFMAMLPEGEIGPDGKRSLIPVAIPRVQRRKMLKLMKADIRKGRFDAGRLNEE